MDPVIIHLGGLEIRWYGVMIALGVMAAFGVQSWRGKRYGITNDNISDVTFIALVAGLIGARTLYVIRFWDDFFADEPFAEVFKIWKGGLVFQGGFIAGLLAVIVYAKVKKLQLGELGDLAAPALPLAHAFGRIGCLLNKCCYGFHPYEGFFAIHYENGQAGYFPVQGLESLCNLVICGILLWLEHRKLARKRLFVIYVMAYTVVRFSVEFARGDYPEEQVHAGLTPAQVICLWLLPALGVAYGVITWLTGVRKAECGTMKQQEKN